MRVENHWTNEETEKLKSMLISGHYYREIGVTLGRPVSSICGKVKREKLATRNTATKRETSALHNSLFRTCKKLFAEGSTQDLRRKAHKKQAFKILANHKLEALLRDRSTDSLTSIEKNDTGCCFVVGDPRVTSECVCGRARLKGEVYCNHHYHRVYVTKAQKKIPKIEPEFA